MRAAPTLPALPALPSFAVLRKLSPSDQTWAQFVSLLARIGVEYRGVENVI